jgi:hypothetical protein
VDGSSALYPSDASLAFEVDEFVEAFEDVRGKLVPTFAIADPAEKAAARAALVAPGTGAAAVLLAKLETYCAQTKPGFMVGTATTLADLWCFFFLNFLTCGFWDGLPAASVSAAQYPKLFAVERRVAKLPKVKKSEGEGEAAAAFSLYASVFGVSFGPYELHVQPAFWLMAARELLELPFLLLRFRLASPHLRFYPYRSRARSLFLLSGGGVLRGQGPRQGAHV